MDDYSTLFSALQNQANLNNSWSAEQAQKQMDFQERMSNTAHLREIADLKSAGLNPVLSAKLGGASTPSGASATADTSLVSSMASLFEKMLDVQETSAKAVLSASSGNTGSYGSYGSSGHDVYNDFVDAVEQSPINPNTAGAVASSIGVPSWIGRVAAAFMNGVKGTPSNKSESSSMAYRVGEQFQPLRQATIEQHNQDDYNLMNSDYGKTVTSAMDKAKAEGKGVVGQWIAGTKAEINYAVNQVKSKVSNLINKAKTVIKKVLLDSLSAEGGSPGHYLLDVMPRSDTEGGVYPRL